ncbi:uncharacterized protein LOC143137167 isoform X2 [Alosa pseudoharengus]|uniref:uncharacterized protein LOC143100725 isoform X2 n=1 Tax=Alosa pseudoharengus TaxID=34774 RepID=UPI003F8BA52F
MSLSHLNSEENRRYEEKIACIGCDPYTVPGEFFKSVLSTNTLPDIHFHDIYIYLIHHPSSYTGASLKAFKSTEAYRYFFAGWVLDPKICLFKKKHFLVKGRVNHSQAVNTTSTQPWIVVHEDGTIRVAHCTCKVGLGEACSHAAALMYALSAAVEQKDNVSCTDMPCAWAPPNGEIRMSPQQGHSTSQRCKGTQIFKCRHQA